MFCEVGLVLGLIHEEGPTLVQPGVPLLRRDHSPFQPEIAIDGNEKAIEPAGLRYEQGVSVALLTLTFSWGPRYPNPMAG